MAVFILQSTAPGDINDGLMELLIMIHAVRMAEAGSCERLLLIQPLCSAELLVPEGSQLSYLTSRTPDRIRKVRPLSMARTG